MDSVPHYAVSVLLCVSVVIEAPYSPRRPEDTEGHRELREVVLTPSKFIAFRSTGVIDLSSTETS